MFRLLIVLLASLSLSAGEAVVVRRADGGTLRPVVPLREIEAGESVDAIDAALAEARSLPPAERRQREAGLGRSLEKLVKTCADTKHLNKALYLLAAWQLAHTDGETVGALLDRLADNPYQAYQQAARMLRVQWLIGRGNLEAARAEAEALALQVPEFAGARDLVAFHEQLGKPAPRTAGMPLAGAAADPATRPEPFLLYYFASTLDDEERYQLGTYLEELQRVEYLGVVRLVCVLSGGNPLTAAAVLRELPGSDHVDLLWASPGADGEARAWAEAWKLPGLPASVLLGPERTILAIQPPAQQLRVLVGKPLPGKRPASGRANPPRTGKTPWGK